jgi:hypothetical protein
MEAVCLLQIYVVCLLHIYVVAGRGTEMSFLRRLPNIMIDRGARSMHAGAAEVPLE